MTKIEFTFDQETHEYRLNGYPLVSVTQVLADLLPQRRASKWYLQRGTAIHSACAMECRGQIFNFDERIKGPINACRNFLSATQPTILSVEKPSFSRRYQFAGTADVVARIDSISSNPLLPVIIDWKSSLSKVVPYQLAAYGILYNCEIGMEVQLNDDGTFRCSELYRLRPFKREFLALLTAYNIRKRLKLTDKEKINENQ